jgi:hypothetical protein
VFLPEIRETLALYFKAVQAHFETKQEMGLEPRSTRQMQANVKAEHTFHHELYTFLDAEEALQLRALEEQVNAGKVDIIQLYKAVGDMFRLEQGER